MLFSQTMSVSTAWTDFPNRLFFVGVQWKGGVIILVFLIQLFSVCVFHFYAFRFTLSLQHPQTPLWFLSDGLISWP